MPEKKLEKRESSPVDSSEITQELIDEANEANIDLGVIYKDRNDLLKIKFNPANPKQYALNILSKIFTEEEIEKGRIDPSRGKQKLDANRVDMLKCKCTSFLFLPR